MYTGVFVCVCGLYLCIGGKENNLINLKYRTENKNRNRKIVNNTSLLPVKSTVFMQNWPLWYMAHIICIVNYSES